MKIIDYLNWFSTLESKEVVLTESTSKWSEKVYLDKGENGLTTKVPFKSSKVLFKENSSFYIQDDEIIVRLKHNRIINSKNIFDYRIFHSYIFETKNFNENEKYFFQYYSKVESYFFLANFLNDGKKELNYKLNSTNFKISISELTENFKGSFLCIEIDEKISFEDFRHYINSIILSIGFFSGFMYKKEEFFFQSRVKDFSNVDFFYKNQNKRLFSHEPFTKFPQNYIDGKIDKFSSSISEEQFCILVNLILENPRYYSSIHMLFGNNKDSFIVEHSVLMVVLETISKEVRSKFHSEHIEKISIKEEAFEILKLVEKRISKENFDTLKDALENIDVKKAKNIIDFELAFSALNINLDDNDRKSLKRRNNIFHGRILSDFEKIHSEESYLKLEEDYKIHSARLYVLIYKLILKQIKFEGYLLNYPKILWNNSNLDEKESFFIKI